MRRAVLLAVVAVVVAAGCADAQDPTIAAVGGAGSSSSSPSVPTTAASTTAAPTTATTSAPTTAPPPTEPPTTVPPAIPVPTATETGFAPYAVVGPLTLVHPAALVVRVAFHESNNDGAQHQDALGTAVNPIVLESRERGTDPQSAADIVVDPATEIRSPVTGTVIRGGTYTLYCDYTDEYVVIEPDDRPGWEVKILHFVGLQVGRGDRVVAGETVIGLHAHLLPFSSQVDDDLNPPGVIIPHVHVEVVDPSIPDRPGEGC